MMPRSLRVEPYLDQVARWPASGRHLMAQASEGSVVVYQAYNPSIGRAAVERGRLGGGGFSFDRMSWIKPNFLWMMFRSGWGTKPGQEVTLAIHLAREGFEAILAEAVPSSHVPELYESRDEWQRAVGRSEVRLQWDPDHLPGGGKCERRAIQLGLRGETLRRFAGAWTLDIEDISPFVAEQRAHALSPYRGLRTPSEAPWLPTSREVAARVGL